jgi:HEAT repeat protein
VASLTAYLKQLREGDAAQRESAAKGLFDLGAESREAVPALLDALISEVDACPWLGTAIVELGPTADDTPKLREALYSNNSHVRFWAARATVNLGIAAFTLTRELIGLLCDQHSPVVDSVIWALGSIGAKAIPSLVEAAKSPNSQLRAQAVLALGRYPEHITSKLPTVLASLDDFDRHVRNCAALAVCSLAQGTHRNAVVDATIASPTLVHALERIASDPSFEVERQWPQRLLGWLSREG